MFTDALGWVAAALAVSLSWPQIRLSCMKGRTHGLSATACWLAAALNLCWFVYGILLADPVQIVTNLLCGAGNVAILVALLRHQPVLRTRRSVAATGWGAGLLVLTAGAAAASAVTPQISGTAAAGALGAVVSFLGIWAYFPQMISLLRDRTQDMSGMSATRWWLATASAACWTGYGLAVGQPAVWALSGVALLCNLVVCYLITVAPRPEPVYAEAPRELALAA